MCRLNDLDIDYHVKYDKTPKKMTKEYFDVTTIKISPQYVKLVSTEEKHAMELTDFLSQIGGFLGLLVGASVVTLFEFLEFFVLAIFYKTKSITLRHKSVTDVTVD